MRKQTGATFDTMALALGVWLCTLPLLAVVVVPLFGWGAAGVTAVGLLMAALLICWGICGWRKD